MSEIASTLREARAIAAEGWSPLVGYGDKSTGNVCAVGAIYVAANGWHRIHDYPQTTSTDTTELAICILAAAVTARGQHGLEDWNDGQGRTKDEVLAAFDRAIEIAEAS